MQKITDTTNPKFYLYENTKLLTLQDILEIHAKEVETLKKQQQKAETLKQKIGDNIFLPSRRQYITFSYLFPQKGKNADKRNKVFWVGLGGGRGGGKTSTAMYWITTMALKYPKTSWGIGRRTIASIKKTTLPSLFEMLNDILKIPSSMYKFNSHDNILRFNNGSVIYLFDMDYKPGDPLYTRLAGMQLTGAVVDEANEVAKDAIMQLKSSIGRANNSKYGIPPKLLLTFNPDKGFVYEKFYLPYVKEQLDERTIYVPSLAINNPYISDEYLINLWELPERQKQRLLLGNFDFEDNEGYLVSYEDVMSLFYNRVYSGNEFYLTLDIGGSSYRADESVFAIWRGYELYDVLIKRELTTDEIIDKILELDGRYRFLKVAVDAVGIGEGVATSRRLSKMVPFKGSEKPIPVQDGIGIDRVKESIYFGQVAASYANLKSQCGFMLAEKITRKQISIIVPKDKVYKINGQDMEFGEIVASELMLLKDKYPDNSDRRKTLITKDEMKKILGRSPNVLDAFIQRMIFDLISEYKDKTTFIPKTQRRFFEKLLRSRRNFK